MHPLLKIQGLRISFRNEKHCKTIIKDSTFHMNSNEIVGIVGESSSGKSVTSLSIMGLLPKDFSKIEKGEIIFQGRPITHLSDQEFQSIRGSQIAMIFQEPMSSLNPSMKCGEQVAEVRSEERRV